MPRVGKAANKQQNCHSPATRSFGFLAQPSTATQSNFFNRERKVDFLFQVLRSSFAGEKVPTIDSGFVPIQKFPFLRSTGSTFSISKCHAWNATHIVLHRLFPNRQGHGNIQRLAEFSYFSSILGKRHRTGEKNSRKTNRMSR